MWEPINPFEPDSFVREIADLPRSFNRDRDSFIIFLDTLGIFYPRRERERKEGRFEDSLESDYFLIFSDVHSKTKTKDSSTDYDYFRVFIFFHSSRLHISFFLSSKFPLENS